MENSKTVGYAPVNGLNMYYEIHGAGDIPLVLIHGGGSTIETTFSNLLPIFSAYNKVIAVELQAHGRTSDRDAPESFAQDADDVAALLRYLGVDKANFLGFSNGGSTTMQIAIRHAELTNKIIAISAVYKRDGFIPGFFDGLQNATLAHMPEFLKIAWLKVASEESFEVMFNKDRERMLTFTDWNDDDLRSIKGDALIMAADHDVITAEHTVNIARLIPGARLAILPATHSSIIGEAGAINEDDKLYERTAEIVKEFLTT